MFYFPVWWGDVNPTEVLWIGINFYHLYISDKRPFKKESPPLCPDNGQFSDDSRVKGATATSRALKHAQELIIFILLD